MAKSFNDFFSNIVKNLKIPKYQCKDDLYNSLSSHSVLQAIECIGITQASTTFGILHRDSQAFIFHKSIKILYSKKSED